MCGSARQSNLACAQYASPIKLDRGGNNLKKQSGTFYFLNNCIRPIYFYNFLNPLFTLAFTQFSTKNISFCAVFFVNTQCLSKNARREIIMAPKFGLRYSFKIRSQFRWVFTEYKY